jgi:hypothetical protein
MDNRANDASQIQVVQQKRFPCGCLIGGCMTVMLVMMISAGVIIYQGYKYYIAQVKQYTSIESVELPKIENPKEAAEAVQLRLDEFKASLENSESPEPLVLTSDDINAMIHAEEQLNGKLYVTIADGKVSAQASFPADIVPGAKGRYFNGRVSLNASLDNGVLIVTLDEAEVNGESLPAEFLNSLRNENLAKDAYKDPKSAEFLRKFEHLTIEKDKLILTPAKSKPKPPVHTEPTVAPNPLN